MKFSAIKKYVMAFRSRRAWRTKIIIDDKIIDIESHFNYQENGCDKNYDWNFN